MGVVLSCHDTNPGRRSACENYLMSTPFTITTTTNTVQIDDRRQARVNYTVFNASGQEMQGRASLASVPPGGPHLAWLGLGGEAERPFGVAAVEQYDVLITVPADAPAGNVTFRLNMVGVHNPDETFCEGPTVTIVVPAPKPVAAGLPKWVIPLAAVLALLLIVALVLVLTNRQVTIPDITTLAEAEAVATLEEAGLREGAVRGEDHPTLSQGQVIRSDPAAGTRVPKDSEVDLVLANAPTPTPTTAPITPTPTPPPAAKPVILVVGSVDHLAKVPTLLVDKGFDVRINATVRSADYALVVVSAIDGPMPQTRTSLNLLVNRPSGDNIAIILTNTRFQDPELMELVGLEVQELIADVLRIRTDRIPILPDGSSSFEADLFELLAP